MKQIKTITTFLSNAETHDETVNTWLRESEGIIINEITHNAYTSGGGGRSLMTSINYTDHRIKKGA